MAENNELVVALKLVADQFKGGLAEADSSLGRFANAVTRMATDWKTASSLMVTSLAAITQAAGRHAEQLEHLSQETGDSTAKLQEMDVLLNRVGVSGEAFARSMKTLAAALAEAKAGTGAGIFQALGFTPEQIQAMTTADDALRAIADRLTNYRDGLAKTDLVAQVFGRQFVALLPVLAGGSAAFDESARKAREFGGVLGAETITQLARADDAMDDLKTALRALRDQIGALFGPVQEFGALIGTWLVAQMTNVVQWVRYAVGATVINILATWDHLLAQLEAGFDRLKLKAKRAITFDQAELDELDLQLGAIDALVQKRTREINRNKDELKLALGDEIAGLTGKKDTRPAAPGFRGTPAKEDFTPYKIMGEAAKEYEDRFQADYTAFLKGIEDADKADYQLRMQAFTEYWESYKATLEKFTAEVEAADKADWAMRGQAEKDYYERLNADMQRSAEEGGRAQEALGRVIVKNTQQELDAAKTFFDRYLEGLQQFVTDNESGFGLVRQMAIDTAQAMSQGFQTFFFDVFTGKIHSMLDLLKNFLNSVLQALSAILARMVTTGLLQGVSSFFAPASGPSGSLNYFSPDSSMTLTSSFVPRMAAGGLVTRPTYALVGEAGPEAVIPLDRLARAGVGGSGDISIVVNNNTGTEAQASARSSRGADGKVLIELILTKVKGAFADGSMDTVMGQNFGLNRRGASR